MIKVMKVDKFDQFIQVYDIIVDLTKMEFFFIMEFAPENLDETLHRLKETYPDKKLPVAAAKDIIGQILIAMDVMHQNNILHRDLKLENILVMANGKIKICDFGLARTVTFRQRRKSDTVCTTPYRPPEICMGEENYLTSVDSWSTGVMIAEILMPGQRITIGGKQYRKYGFFDQENPSYLQTVFETLGDAREESDYLQKYEKKEEYRQFTKELPQKVQKKGI